MVKMMKQMPPMRGAKAPFKPCAACKSGAKCKAAGRCLAKAK